MPFRFLKNWLKPDVTSALAEFGGEEIPYGDLRENTPAENQLLPSETVVFEGVPTHRTFSSHRKSAQKRVPSKTQESLQLRLTKSGTDYFWKSRKGFKLTYLKNGKFHYFVEPKTGGYIKIVEQGARFAYAEHFTYSMISFTNWGYSDTFVP